MAPSVSAVLGGFDGRVLRQDVTPQYLFQHL